MLKQIAHGLTVLKLFNHSSISVSRFSVPDAATLLLYPELYVKPSEQEDLASYVSLTLISEGFYSLMSGSNLKHRLKRREELIMAYLKSKSVKQSDMATLLLTAIPEGVLIKTIVKVVNDGGTVQFGRTKDGSTLIVTFYDGKEAEKAYVTDATELLDLLQFVSG